jgi:hypothetical protein
MKFSEIANRLTGISTPLLGVSWQPTDLEVSAARRVIAFLEDRRVLYAPEEMEMPEHCVRSVLEIRHFLSDEIGKHDSSSGFAASLRAMRAACRKFLDRVGVDGREVALYANHHGHWAGGPPLRFGKGGDPCSRHHICWLFPWLDSCPDLLSGRRPDPGVFRRPMQSHFPGPSGAVGHSRNCFRRTRSRYGSVAYTISTCRASEGEWRSCVTCIAIRGSGA